MKIKSFRPRTVWSTAVYLLPELRLPIRGKPDLLLSTKRMARCPQAIHTIADPFLFSHDRDLYLFYECQNLDEPGRIMAHLLKNSQWHALGTVLAEPFHLSYPYVFEFESEQYMLPESQESNTVRLYKFDSFPNALHLHKILLTGPYADPSLLKLADTWYLFATSAQGLELFTTTDIVNKALTPHPSSPIKVDPRYARCGGAPLEIKGQLFRLAQDNKDRYGGNLKLMAITEITPTTYHEKLSDLQPFDLTQPWNLQGGHHLSVAWLSDVSRSVVVAVDGQVNDYYHHKLITRAWMMITNYKRGKMPFT